MGGPSSAGLPLTRVPDSVTICTLVSLIRSGGEASRRRTVRLASGESVSTSGTVLLTVTLGDPERFPTRSCAFNLLRVKSLPVQCGANAESMIILGRGPLKDLGVDLLHDGRMYVGGEILQSAPPRSLSQQSLEF